MPNHFLCPNHRQWLINNPLAAFTHLIDTQDTGQYYREQGAWRQALPYLGCAYETAEIVLTQGEKAPLKAVIDFTSCAIILADTFKKIGQKAMSLTVYQQAQQRLKAELPLGSQQARFQSCILDCLKSLASGIDFQHQFAGTQKEGTKSCSIH